ncbi:helix-turn-helix domain-containing protein [Aquabacterium sp.]|uniref:helix-turn-helix domain-containing protein n=1 Tax=Aquabacterium sp. TaxID=1872578 RepID=UPI0024896FD8|nr:helix-turn-helix domain-containing protein [Aquabacterium sp.]MDI1259207.1 helix-turn-helix domain-containing protein [Aquabacterium sp.]
MIQSLEIEHASDSICLLTAALQGGHQVAAQGRPWLHLSVAMLHRAVHYLGSFTVGARPTRPGQIAHLHLMSVARPLIQGAAAFFEEWPKGFHSVLRDLHGSAKVSLSVRQTFSPLYRVIYEDLADDCYQFIRDAFEDYLHDAWQGTLSKRNGLLRKSTVEMHPRITIPQAASAIGVNQGVARQLARRQQAFVTVQMSSGRQAHTLHVDAVVKLKALADGVMTLEEASQDLALPERRLRELIAADVIAPAVSRSTQKKRAAWLIPKKEVERLYVVSGLPSGPACTTVHDLLKYGCLRSGESVELVRAVLFGVLKVHGPSKTEVPIGMASVGKQDAKNWLSSCRATKDDALTVDQAAKKLGLKQEVAYSLVKAGLLQARKEVRIGWRVPLASVGQFQNDFVALAALAKAWGRSPKALLVEMAAKPVSGPTVDGCRQYFFRRIDVFGNDLELKRE